MEAAFFDLDKTVIAGSSMMAFARPFRRAGLLNRRAMVNGACTQFLYVRRGAGPKRLARIQRSVLAVTAGWDRAKVSSIVAEHLADAIDPVTYTDALLLIDAHRRAGRRVFLISAGPEDIVEPIGRRLGFDETIATQITLDDQGCYAGTLERYAYGAVKAALMAEAAQLQGIDLTGSWAYSDSATDAPMLEVVGHPVAVNPDRALRELARHRGWDVVRFEGIGGKAAAAGITAGVERAYRAAAEGALGVPSPDLQADPMWPAGRRAEPRPGLAGPDVQAAPNPLTARTPDPLALWRGHWATLASTAAAVAVVATGGGLTAWRWRRRRLVRTLLDL